MLMRADRSLIAGGEVGYRQGPLQAAAGALLGLGYIIALPFIGLAYLIFLCGCLAQQSFISIKARLSIRLGKVNRP